MAAKEREQARLGLVIHANRADVKLTLITDEGERREIAARALLPDFKPQGVYLYTTERLPPNLEVLFEIEDPDSFKLVGKVIYCQYQPSSSRILSEQPFPYRVGMGLYFPNAEDENRFREFCQRMQDNYVSPRVTFEKKPDILERISAQEDSNKSAAEAKATARSPETEVAGAPSGNVVNLKTGSAPSPTASSESSDTGAVDAEVLAMLTSQTTATEPVASTESSETATMAPSPEESRTSDESTVDGSEEKKAA